MEKKAELALSEADKFPRESMRERLSRRFGLDAIALSGPCEGQPIATCVVDQLEKRWDRVKQKLSKSQDKLNKLAFKLAESYMSKDDTKECVQDLKGLGYKEAAAAGIATYLKAYALDNIADEDFDSTLDEVAKDPESVEPVVEELPPAEVPSMDDVPEPVAEPIAEEPMGELLPPKGETVTVELPKELVEELGEAIQQSIGGAEEPMGGEIVEEPIGGTEDSMGDLGGIDSDLGGLDIEIIEEPGMETPIVEEKEVVPGEPTEEVADHKVEGGTCAVCGGKLPAEEKQCSCGCAGGCGQKAMASEKEEGKKEEKKEIVEKVEKEESPAHEKKESPAFEKGEKEVKETVKEEVKEASGKKPVLTAAEIAKLGPKMQLNSTDQIGPHKGKELGNAKEKAVEAPKSLPEGNVDTEGYSAGDKKFQDGKTLGHEEKFDAKEVEKGSVTGGQSSIMGKDESYPKGPPSVPAGSAPIGGEKLTGGDVSTKGTIIATITPKGIVVESGSKKQVAEHKITIAMVPAIEAGLSKIAFTDMDNYVKAALQTIVEAEKSGTVDNVTKTDTGKLEGSTFTNDGKKEPAKGGAMTGKGKASKSDEGQTKTDTSEKEAKDFTNDAKKEPDKKASTEKEVKTAKPVADPKPISENIETDGYSAGDKKFQDGKTLGHEEKFDAKDVVKSDVSKGKASEMGKNEEFPTGKADVPAGDGKMGNEPWSGGNVETKGTIIADSQKPVISDESKQLAEAKVAHERLKAASVYAAELLAHGDITSEEYPKELEKAAQLPVPAIQAMISNIKKARARITARVASSQGETKVGMSIPVVIAQCNDGPDLVQRLVKEFKLTRDLDRIDTMPEKK